jgi:hypothetical protein
VWALFMAHPTHSAIQLVNKYPHGEFPALIANYRLTEADKAEVRKLEAEFENASPPLWGEWPLGGGPERASNAELAGTGQQQASGAGQQQANGAGQQQASGAGQQQANGAGQQQTYNVPEVHEQSAAGWLSLDPNDVPVFARWQAQQAANAGPAGPSHVPEAAGGWQAPQPNVPGAAGGPQSPPPSHVPEPAPRWQAQHPTHVPGPAGGWQAQHPPIAPQFAGGGQGLHANGVEQLAGEFQELRTTAAFEQPAYRFQPRPRVVLPKRTPAPSSPSESTTSTLAPSELMGYCCFCNAPATHILYTCNHLAMCEPCAEEMLYGDACCPVCNCPDRVPCVPSPSPNPLTAGGTARTSTRRRCASAGTTPTSGRTSAPTSRTAGSVSST